MSGLTRGIFINFTYWGINLVGARKSLTDMNNQKCNEDRNRS